MKIRKVPWLPDCGSWFGDGWNESCYEFRPLSDGQFQLIWSTRTGTSILGTFANLETAKQFAEKHNGE